MKYKHLLDCDIFERSSKAILIFWPIRKLPASFQMTFQPLRDGGGIKLFEREKKNHGLPDGKATSRPAAGFFQHKDIPNKNEKKKSSIIDHLSRKFLLVGESSQSAWSPPF